MKSVELKESRDALAKLKLRLMPTLNIPICFTMVLYIIKV